MLFPVLGSPGAQGYDFVDNNTSNVDGVSDRGTHSNFTAQQYGPDSIYDTLTEENTGGDVTWTNNTRPSALILETDPDISGSATTYETYGLNNLASDDSTYGGGDIQNCGTVNDPQEVSLIMEFDYSGLGISGSDISYLRFEAEVYFIGGTGRAPINDPWEMETPNGNLYNGSVETYNWDSDSWEIMGTVFMDNPADLSIWDNTGDVNPERPLIRYKDSSFSDAYMNTSGYIRIRIQMTGVFQGTAFDGCSVIDYVDVDLQYGGENYELDLEVQWTNANYTRVNEELCIYGGTMGSENIRVDVWDGSTWHNLLTDLLTGWNNVSVTDYLVSSTLTISFKGGAETGDTSQDSWKIDCTLLRTWGVAPTASFSYTPEYPHTGETVTFNASDSYDPDGTIVSYFWDFGDGANGTGEIVSHIYADNAIYTVTLTVADNDGLSDVTSKGITVLNRPPTATFTESAETVYTGDIITFNASDSYDPDGYIVNYFWDFGDETNATGEIVDHSYADNGTYTATLTVTDDDGATASTSALKTILNRSPVAMFTESATTALTGEVIYFNASDSYDLDGSIVSYFWDFGDGTNASGVTVNHSYADDGTYTVTLTVTDDDGATASTNAIKTVLNRPPVASFTESAETVHTGEAITFNASASYDPDGYIVSYFWDFGDGTNLTGVIVEHAYVDDGVYNVTLTVTDDDGATASTSAAKTVLNRPPEASFTESAETVLTGEPITFNASASYDPDGSIVSYFWDFGDGSNATDVVVNHAYSDDGVYTVTLTVTDDDDTTASTSAIKTILNRPPVALFTESAETVHTGEAITFNASASYDPDGSIVSYFWDFGDATNTTGVVVSHTYADDGNYTVTLTITDDDGATDATTSTKTVLNRPPVAVFTESAETVYTGDIIAFNASESSDPDGYIVTYYWDFGDNTNATGAVVEHAYTDDGNYVVTLTVTDDDGATDVATATKTVMNRPPVASFTETAHTVDTGDIITFDASASYDPDGMIVSYFWDFGDGTNTTGIIVNHSYAEDGTYTVTLMLTDDDGATASSSAIKTVLNRPPVASFTESAETVVVDETIYFNASASYDPDGYIVSYFWDFGDGTNATGVTAEHAYADNGVYIVTLTITDNDGAVASATATKNVEVTPPIAIFTESAETVYTDEFIYFNASDSYDPDGYIVGYFWDFGDGTNATGVTVEHAYADDGNYTVTLTVTDDDGATDTATSIKTVLNRPPIGSFTETAETVLTGEFVTLNASNSYDPDGSIVSYFWNFGDGTNATGVVAEHAYSDDGNYTVTLTVTDDDGATGVATATKTVLNRPPVAFFTESATTVFTGEVIYFNASDSYDPDGYIVSYFWDFGDGTNASGVTAEHAYADDGNYTVTVTVTDDDGATNTTTSTKNVLNVSPIASFTESAETVHREETITFNASGSYDPDGSIVSYFWDFGDGTNATSVIVDHAYVDDGVYTVTLTVIDDDGASASTSATKTVLNWPPVAIFTYSPYPSPLVNETVTFNASASYDPDGVVVGYFWDFGDGTNATDVVVTHIYAVQGMYTVNLTVTDNEGSTGITTHVISVITLGVHDVAVVGVTPSTTEVLQGEILNITAIVKNEGTTIETFNVTVYATPMNGWQLVEADGHLVWYSDGVPMGDFLILITVNVPTGAPVLTFDTKYDIEMSWDFGFVQVSRDGGITWISLENAYTTYDHDPNAHPDIIANLPGLTGTSDGWPGWLNMTFDLTDYAGETVMLGFRYMTDWRTLEEGWYVDNIKLNGNAIPNEAFWPYAPSAAIPIQTKIVNNLAPSNQETIIFTWNTTDVELSSYIIYAKATPVLGETDLVDNTLTDGWIVVMIPSVDADFTGSGYPPASPPDGVIDINDIRYFIDAYKSQYGIPPPTGVDPTLCDLTGSGYPPASLPDGVIDINDIRYFIALYKAQYT